MHQPYSGDGCCNSRSKEDCLTSLPAIVERAAEVSGRKERCGMCARVRTSVDVALHRGCSWRRGKRGEGSVRDRDGSGRAEEKTEKSADTQRETPSRYGPREGERLQTLLFWVPRLAKYHDKFSCFTSPHPWATDRSHNGRPPPPGSDSDGAARQAVRSVRPQLRGSRDVRARAKARGSRWKGPVVPHRIRVPTSRCKLRQSRSPDLRKT